MGRTKVSVVWKYMTKKDDRTVICNVCSQELVYSHRSTTNMMRHIKIVHAAEVVLTENNSTPESSPSKSPNVPSGSWSARPAVVKQEKLQKRRTSSLVKTEKSAAKGRIDPIRKKLLDQALLSMILIDLKPVSLVDVESFKRLTFALDSTYELVSKETLASELLPEKYAQEKERLMKELESVHHLSITTEFWYAQETEFLTVTAHFINKEWKYISRTLKTRECPKTIPGEYLAEELVILFQQWGVESKVSTMVTDGAVNARGAAEILGLQHHSCFAHRLNLAVKNAIQDTEEVNNCRAKLRKVVLFFLQSQAGEDRLREVHASNNTQYKDLKLDDPTCWYSFYEMLSSYIYQHQEATAALHILEKTDLCVSSEELSTMELVVNSLAPFYEATMEMSNEVQISSSKIIPLVFLLIQFVSNDNFNLGRNLIIRMQDQFMGIEFIDHLKLSTLLDPRFKCTGFPDSLNAESAVERLKATVQTVEVDHPYQEEDTDETPSNSTSLLWSRFDARIKQEKESTTTTPLPSLVESDIRRYLETGCISRDNNPLVWWSENSKHMPRLVKIVKDVMSVPATSLPSKRLFGKKREDFAIRRELLEPEYADMILFLHDISSADMD